MGTQIVWTQNPNCFILVPGKLKLPFPVLFVIFACKKLFTSIILSYLSIFLLSAVHRLYTHPFISCQPLLNDFVLAENNQIKFPTKIYSLKHHSKKLFSEVAILGVLSEKVFLEILQNSQENTCNFIKKDSGTGVFL